MIAHRIIHDVFRADVVLVLRGDQLEHYPAVIPAALKRDLTQHRREVIALLRASATLPPCERCGGQLLHCGNAVQCVACGQAELLRLARKRAALEKAIDEHYRIERERGRQ